MAGYVGVNHEKSRATAAAGTPQCPWKGEMGERGRRQKETYGRRRVQEWYYSERSALHIFPAVRRLNGAFVII